MINQWELDAFLWPEISGDAGDGHCPNRPEVTNFALSVILWILAMQSIQFVSYVPRFERNCHRISNPRWGEKVEITIRLGRFLRAEIVVLELVFFAPLNPLIRHMFFLLKWWFEDVWGLFRVYPCLPHFQTYQTRLHDKCQAAGQEREGERERERDRVGQSQIFLFPISRQ